LEPLDRQLLKGVYTNNVMELENPPLIRLPPTESAQKVEKKEAVDLEKQVTKQKADVLSSDTNSIDAFEQQFIKPQLDDN